LASWQANREPGLFLLKRIRTLLRYAMALGWTDRDTTAGVKAYRSKEIHTWNEEEIATFEKYWPEGSRERLEQIPVDFTHSLHA
jgi:enterobacteria phage integrase